MEKNAIVVTVCGAKGGTGKTSTSANMGGILADLGKQVCLIDMAPIDHISLYDRNPRREKNPRYAEIRASLLGNGLQEILNVTQRPDARPEH